VIRRLVIVAVVVASSYGMHAATAAPAQAAAKGIDGRCGVHRGVRVVPWLHRYHVRIGPKHRGGWAHCRGVYATRHKGTAGFDLMWHPFDLPDWNYRGIADVTTNAGITAGVCAGAAAAFSGTFPTASLTGVIAIGMGAGCARGIVDLSNQVQNTNFRVRR
jgi:hypothetical protein